MGFVSQPHKCDCLGGYCWKNLCPLQRNIAELPVPSSAGPKTTRRRLKTVAERIRVFSASPEDPTVLAYRTE